MNYDDIPEVEGFKKIPLGRGENFCNKKFGKLTALYRTEYYKHGVWYVCQCDCGNIVIREINHIKKHNMSSCGCAKNEVNYNRGLNVRIKNGNYDADYENIIEINGFKKIPLCNAVNISNKKFNSLTALYRTRIDEGRRSYWLCQCDCGKYIEVYYESLIKNEIKSCGCKEKEYDCTLYDQENFKEIIKKIDYVDIPEIPNFKKIPLKRSKDIRNIDFKTTTALYRTENTIGDCVNWVFKCQCGKIYTECPNIMINYKYTKSCGCLAEYGKNLRENSQYWGQNKIKLLPGQKFNKLTVIREASPSNNGEARWECLCDCGNIAVVDSWALRTGHTKSCGCQGSNGQQKIIELLSKNNYQFKTEKTFEDLYNTYHFARLRYDFYVNNKYIIEYDGIQHFIATGGWSTEEQLEKTKKIDAQKTKYCKDNNIPLIRIPYTAYDTLCIDDLKLETTKYRVV